MFPGGRFGVVPGAARAALRLPFGLSDALPSER
jgi:hypothetical protein